MEGEPVDDDPEVVEKGERDHHRPIVTQTSRGIEDEGPIRGALCSLCSWLPGVASAAALLLLLLHRVPPAAQRHNDLSKATGISYNECACYYLSNFLFLFFRFFSFFFFFEFCFSLAHSFSDLTVQVIPLIPGDVLDG